jgi:hypothetical protein
MLRDVFRCGTGFPKKRESLHKQFS